MTCRRIVLGRGVQVWSCHRSPPVTVRCTGCGGAGGILTCSFDLRGAKAGQRCDKALCQRCAGGGPALCAPRRKLVAQRGAAARGEP